MIERPPCKFEGCTKLSAKSCKGWCGMHHTRWYRHGDPGVKKAQGGKLIDAAERIKERTVSRGGCLVYTGTRLPNGYGYISHRGRSRYVHRVAWELANGRAVPDGLLIHHACHTKLCCNPEHLVAVTRLEHAQAHRKEAA